MRGDFDEDEEDTVDYGPTFNGVSIKELAKRPTMVICPMCGAEVKQVSSATLSVALWQHVNWSCEQDVWSLADFATNAIRGLFRSQTDAEIEIGAVIREHTGALSRRDFVIQHHRLRSLRRA